MKNIKTKRGEFFLNQLLIGIGFFILASIFILFSFALLFAIFLMVIGMSAIWTSWHKVYYCKRCENKHGEYPYNSCEKCGGREFVYRINKNLKQKK